VLIPALKYIIDVSSGMGVDSFVMGMPHRSPDLVISCDRMFTDLVGDV